MNGVKNSLELYRKCTDCGSELRTTNLTIDRCTRCQNDADGEDQCFDPQTGVWEL